MNKILIILAVILLVFIAGTFIYARYINPSDTPKPPADQLTVEKEGIQVAVESIERAGGQTVIKLVMDNHVYSLGEFAVKNFSSLNGVRPSDYKIEGDQVGGHHLEADLIFSGELSGKLVVGLKDDLQFEFDIE
ncbi:MAG: hypothetical protein HZC26_00915 [Candidatus Magasanikbacteria bacterium]|nr:hypothetical protein [Candidatus Magasanikbacteria bacterium]